MTNDLQHFGGAWECVDAWMDNTVETCWQHPNRFASLLATIMSMQWSLIELDAYAERGTETPSDA